MKIGPVGKAGGRHLYSNSPENHLDSPAATDSAPRTYPTTIGPIAMMLTVCKFLNLSAIVKTSPEIVWRSRYVFPAIALISLALLLVVTVVVAGWLIPTGLLTFHGSSISLDMPLLAWRIGGYVAADSCGPTLHYGFSGPGLSTTGDGLVLDLWCAQAVLRESDKRPLVYW